MKATRALNSLVWSKYTSVHTKKQIYFDTYKETNIF